MPHPAISAPQCAARPAASPPCWETSAEADSGRVSFLARVLLSHCQGSRTGSHGVAVSQLWCCQLVGVGIRAPDDDLAPPACCGSQRGA